MLRVIMMAALLCASEACRRVLVNGVWVRRCV
jgi:hypothetical protein